MPQALPPLRMVHLIGPANAGKTWLRKVVFERRLPLELILEKREAKVTVTKLRSTDFLHLDIYDWPDDAGAAELEERADAVVYVFDGQEDLRRSMLQDVRSAFERARSLNPNVVLQVFVNKVDGDNFASEEFRVEFQQLYESQLRRELPKEDFTLHLSSVYNPSIYEVWSLLVQKLVPHHTAIVDLLDALVEVCRMEKAFLFDVRTRLYLATDHNPVDHQTMTLCADSIDLIAGFDSVYGASPNVFDSDSGNVSTKVRLANNMVLFAQQVGRCLALVCVARKESWSDSWTIERNVQLFTQALHEIRTVSGDDSSAFAL